MKKKLVGVVIVMMTGLCSFAYETWTDPSTGLTWKYEVIGNEVSVGGDNDPDSMYPALPTTTSGAVVIPSVINEMVVTRIGTCAFEDCGTLTSVTIPSSVTSLGSCAFRGCGGLTSIMIPSGVESILEGAFECCDSMMAFDVDSDNSYYKSDNRCLLSMDGRTLVAGVNGDVTIPAGVTRICADAFYGCSGLTSITIPTSVTSIGNSAFTDCSSLTSVTIPSGVMNIEDLAFGFCSALTLVVIPSSVTSISYGAFMSCGSLMTFNVDSGNPYYKSANGCLLSKDGKTLVAGVNGDVTIPAGVTTIADYAFFRCSSLTSVMIPSSVTNIGDDAFYGCDSLMVFNVDSGNPYYKSDKRCLLSKDGKTLVAGVNGNVTVPKGVTTIEHGAFSGCSGLTSIMIPSSVASVGEGAFWDCEQLTTVYVKKGDSERVRGMLEDAWCDTFNLIFIELDSLEEVFIVGAKSEVDVGLVGYKASPLPKGLSYNSKTGKVVGTAKEVGEYEVTFSKSGEAEVTMVFVVRKENQPSIVSPILRAGQFTAGVSGAVGGIPLDIDAESGVKSVSQKGLPTGFKLVKDKDTGKWTIQGAATKTGTFNVTLTLTTTAGTKVEKKYTIEVAAPHEMAVGTFNGFVYADDDNVGSLQMTTTDTGKITAKVVNARGTFSFSGTSWDAVESGIYSVTLKTKKNDELILSVNTCVGWNDKQLTGTFFENGKGIRQVAAQRNAYGKQWYFTAMGDEWSGWTFAYTTNAKAADLIVSLNADGKTSIAGKLVGALSTLKVSASGYCDVSAVSYGATIADFAPVVTVNKVKKVLSIKTLLWFDRKNEHEVIGSAKLVD